jgi:hypothetical protein
MPSSPSPRKALLSSSAPATPVSAETKDEMVRVFRKFDANDDAWISVGAGSAVRERGQSATKDKVSHVMEEADADTVEEDLARAGGGVRGQPWDLRGGGARGGSVSRTGGGELSGRSRAGGERSRGGEPHGVAIEFFECCNG